MSRSGTSNKSGSDAGERNKLIGLVVAILVAIGLLGWMISESNKPALPTAPVEPGAMPTTRAPDEPVLPPTNP